ncbi:MAG: DEAD/DEAH box helicase [Cyclobacteriaceae bacterium]|nr:DEAD/DEAH box helicase [Cyclobacteriaceae bacterium]MCH8518089.1 DEAD/DEAH box helicase [Cyclobacteriaceae bacterium]
MTFKELNLVEPIQRALDLTGYINPTPIQAQAIPHVLEGRDLLGCAQTGTGKTAAFSIPLIQQIYTSKEPSRGIQALILSPTRELAIQIDNDIATYGKFTGLKHTVIFGGVSQHGQVNALKRGVDILVATPGRLLDLIGQGFIKLGNIKHFILDEADQMLDMGFVHDVKRVIALIPRKRQTLFFSATMPKEITQLADSLLTDPVKVEVTPPASTVDRINQSLYYVDKKDKTKLLLHLLKEKQMGSTLVFTATKHGADKVVKELIKSDIEAAAIHGNKSQNNRQKSLQAFKDGKLQVLVATDIAARGIDIDELEYVFNYELPNVPETYVHRIGRTGRAGHGGVAIAMCDPDERRELVNITKVIKKDIPVEKEHPFSLPESSLKTPIPKQTAHSLRQSKGRSFKKSVRR